MARARSDLKSWASSGEDLYLDLRFDPDKSGGVRHRLEHALREAIRDGRLSAGTRLPSSRALATDLGLARGTVVEA